MRMARTQPPVLVEGRGLGPEGDPARPAPLAHHVDHVLVEVDVLRLEPCTSPRPQPFLMKVRTWPRRVGPRTWRPRRSSAVFAGRRPRRRVRGPRGLLVASSAPSGRRVPHPPRSATQPLEQLLEAAVPPAAVVGFQRSSASAMNVSMWSRVMLDDRRDAEAISHEGLEPLGAVAVGAYGLRGSCLQREANAPSWG